MKKYSILCLLILSLLLVADQASPCSMFKITINGKTMVGNNEDAWRTNSKIWFETGKNGYHGAMYIGHEDGFPQGGLNEAGLAFDGFTVYPRALKPVAGRMKIENPGNFLKTILQRCATVQEVRDLVNQYDRSVFNYSMLLFVDKQGDYLVVEVDTTILGHEQKYVLSNFCPSLTPDLDDVQIGRYRKGRAFLQNKVDTSLHFCVSVMDTMHECRSKIGDGTTYTSIYDLSQGLIHLYFYHNFQHRVSFNLQQELAKGDHGMLMASLFPPNAEYIRFTQYKTPFNSSGVKLSLNLITYIFLLTLPFFLVYYAWEYKLKRHKGLWPRHFLTGGMLVIINLALAYYLQHLLTNKVIFYFDTPYKEEGNPLLNLAAYFPNALLLLFIPIVVFAVRNIRQRPWNRFYLFLYLINVISYSILLVLFGYWELYFIG
ncbi:hypothetical protein HB364_31760 [Pseudoflavitalea sp. X16]|uniref:hypothetical protein n=1 Tax=Paraflavitalea devenefica TaxID=2716334 RepID=UPI0014226A37|nr:hypothetical protein [Paraflavitalea devenefica]NII29697.1 hypothetical protein [Paraflavitalea devenefica]